MAAVIQYGAAIQYAADELQADPTIVKAAVEQDDGALHTPPMPTRRQVS